MNKSFVKLLQSCAGVLLLSTAGLSMAATWDYDFDGDENERGGQPLNFGDLNVKGYTDGARSCRLIWIPVILAGLGVCDGPILLAPQEPIISVRHRYWPQSGARRQLTVR